MAQAQAQTPAPATKAQAPAPASQAPAQASPDPYLYLFYNAYTGSSQYLARDELSHMPGALTMLPGYSALRFTFNSLSRDSTVFNICTTVNGTMCLDILDQSPPVPYLAPPSNSTGQCWYKNAWNDGTWQLVSAATGPDLHLDVYADTKQAQMANGDHTGQHWTFSKIAANPVPSSTSTSSRTPSSTPQSTSISTVAAVSPAGITGGVSSPMTGKLPEQAQNQTSGISHAAVAGIVVGASLPIILCVFILLYWRLRKRKQPTESAAPHRPYNISSPITINSKLDSSPTSYISRTSSRTWAPYSPEAIRQSRLALEHAYASHEKSRSVHELPA